MPGSEASSIIGPDQVGESTVDLQGPELIGGPDQGQGRTSARARGWGQTMARGRARPRATGFARTRWGARPDGGPEQGQGQAHGPLHRPLPQTSAATPCH